MSIVNIIADKIKLKPVSGSVSTIDTKISSSEIDDFSLNSNQDFQNENVEELDMSAIDSSTMNNDFSIENFNAQVQMNDIKSIVQSIFESGNPDAIPEDTLYCIVSNIFNGNVSSTRDQAINENYLGEHGLSIQDFLSGDLMIKREWIYYTDEGGNEYQEMNPNLYSIWKKDSNGNYVAMGWTNLLSNSSKIREGLTTDQILDVAKDTAQYINENEFNYGNASVMPAFDDSEKIVSCDRFIDMILYRLGFVNQKKDSGYAVHGGLPVDYPKNLAFYCESQGFEMITDPTNLQPGDIIFQGSDNPSHVFLLGNEAENGLWERYDAGSNERIHLDGKYSDYETQPFIEELPDNFMFAYRIVKE